MPDVKKLRATAGTTVDDSTYPAISDEVLHALGTTRKKIRRAKKKLDALYAQQNTLYVAGHEAGLPIAWMAKAGGDKLAVGEQAVRQVIRRAERPDLYDPDNGYRQRASAT